MSRKRLEGGKQSYFAGALIATLVLLCGCGSGNQNLASPRPPDTLSVGAQKTTNRFLYVSNSGSGTVSGFAIDPSTGALTPVPGSPFSTPTPAGLARDGSGKYLTVANGSVSFPAGISVIGVNPDTGTLFDLHCIDTEFPGNPPCYPVGFTRNGTSQFVAVNGENIYVGYLGSDDITALKQDITNGDLGSNASVYSAGVTGLRFLDFVGGSLWAAGDSGIAELSAGTLTVNVKFVLDNSHGYRAAAMHSSGKYLYAIDTGDFIHDFCFDPQCALGEELQAPVASPDGATSIAVLGNFAYVTHTSSADVSVYSIDPGSCTGNTCTISGALTFVTSVPAGRGATSARIFLREFLYVANAQDGTISGYKIDGNTGLLTPVAGSPFTSANPTFIAAP